MRGPAPAATPPTWTQPHHTGLPAGPPPPGGPPPGQRPRAARARQLSSHQPPFDLGNILAYRQHQVPHSAHRRAALPETGQRITGGPLPSKPRHSDDEQQEGQPTRVALEHILTVNDANQPLRPHPERSGTPCQGTRLMECSSSPPAPPAGQNGRPRFQAYVSRSGER